MGNMFATAMFSQRWWEFLEVLVEKEMRVRYKMAVLGFAWIFINPVIQMLVMGLVFQFFVPIKSDNYFEFLFPGLLVWNFFSYTISKCTSIYIGERALIKKASFPKETLVLAVVTVNILHFLLALVMFVSFEWIFLAEVHWWRWWLLILITGWLAMLTIGLSLWFSTWNVKWRDVGYAVSALMPLWFYATPIIYGVDLLPDWLAKIVYLNPMTGIVELLRWSTIGTNVNWLAVGVGLVTTVITGLVGWNVFRKNSDYFDDWL